eukprot:TRINITY_DN48605_c0_g1_i1.p1 TRINITY_DN48605_c0_g1~~TRINITY_DN48605_c0_g1_i1.p1  ORF type:complete len:434 (-),score=35.60 TRINITY_DN48605_c0_g1_i1:75-1376(-)
MSALTQDDKVKLHFNYYGRILRPSLWVAPERPAARSPRQAAASVHKTSAAHLTPDRPTQRFVAACQAAPARGDQAMQPRQPAGKPATDRPSPKTRQLFSRPPSPSCTSPKLRPASAGTVLSSASTRFTQARPTSAPLSRPSPSSSFQTISPSGSFRRPSASATPARAASERPTSARRPSSTLTGPRQRPSSAPPLRPASPLPLWAKDQPERSPSAESFCATHGSIYYQFRGKDKEPGPGHYQASQRPQSPHVPTSWAQRGSQERELSLDSCEMYNHNGPDFLAYKANERPSNRKFPRYGFSEMSTERSERGCPLHGHSQARFAHSSFRPPDGNTPGAWVAWAQGMNLCERQPSTRMDIASKKDRLEFNGASWRLGELVMKRGNESGPSKPAKASEIISRARKRGHNKGVAIIRQKNSRSVGAGAFRFSASRRF